MLSVGFRRASPGLCRLLGQPVATFIELVARMPFHLRPLDPVDASELEQALPQIPIFDILAIAGAPPRPLPPVDPPLAKSVDQVRAVGVEGDCAWPVESLQSLDRRQELHALVGRMRLSPGELLFMVAEAQDGTPPPGSGIA